MGAFRPGYDRLAFGEFAGEEFRELVFTTTAGEERIRVIRLAPAGFAHAEWSLGHWSVLDGLKVDEAGNVYACGPGGVWILSAEGERLGLLKLREDPHNLAWGDEDGRALYITALTSIYRIRCRIAGIRPQ